MDWYRFGGALALGVFSVAVLLTSVIWSVSAPGNDRAPLAFAVAAIGIGFFLGILMLGNLDQRSFRTEPVRHAIAAAFVTAYITLLAFLVWHGPFQGADLGGKLVTNFTDLMQIIIPFYFASELGVRYLTAKADRDKSDSGEGNASSDR